MAQLIKPQIKWTEEKIELLRKEYPFGNKKELAKFLGIKYSTLKNAARRFKIKSEKPLRKLAYAKLLEDFDEAVYWQGFIMGDGNILDVGRLTVTLSIKDQEHLESLNNFIPGNIKRYLSKTIYSDGEYIRYTNHDKTTANRFLNRYKLNGPKTYNPPDLSFLDSKSKFLSFFIGLFDADGCFDIRKQKNTVASLKIEVHSSWKPTLELIKYKLKEILNIESSVKDTTRGYGKLTINKFQYIKILKQEAINLKLPILNRKWDNVNLEYTSKKYIVQESLDIIDKMLLEKKSWKDISEYLKLSVNSCRRSYNRLTKNKNMV